MQSPQPIYSFGGGCFSDKTFNIGELDTGPDTNKFKIIHLTNIDGSTITIDNKILKCIFEDCDDVNIHINNDIIGCIEFIRCNNINVQLRETLIDVSIPYVQLDMCSGITFYDENKTLLIVATQCMDIKSNDEILPVSMFDEQRIMWCDDGLMYKYSYTRDMVGGNNLQYIII